MKHPRRASRVPLKEAALAVRQSRPGGDLGGAVSCVGGVLWQYAQLIRSNAV